MSKPRSDAASVDLPARILGRLRTRHAVLVRSAEDLLDRTHSSAEQLRRLRAELRRFRAEYRLWRLLAPRGAAERARVLDGRVSELSRRVGEVRDFDVHLMLLEEADARKELPEVREHREELIRRLADDARIGRELLRAYVRAERDAGLFSELEATLRLPPGPRAVASVAGGIRRELSDRGTQLVRAFRRAARKPTLGRAHRLRVQLRRTRYLSEFLGTVGGVAAPRYPRRLEDLQRRLGRVHDLDLLVEWTEGLSTDLRGAPWAKGVRRRRKLERRKLVDELHRRSLRDVVRSLGGE